MKKIELFIPFSKIDVEKRQVWGRITQESPDKSREIFDYESSVPYFKAWNEEFSARTDGESVGNVREMHQPSAVGKFIEMIYNDEERAIDAGSHISDDAAWQKVLDKVYTGFSIGGVYVKKWRDGEFTRFTAKPSETSLVDNPCLGKATFTQIIKAEGMDEVESTLGALRKGLYTVADFAAILQSLAWMCMGAQDEAAYEGDDSPIPAAFGQWVADGLGILQAMTAEEIAELVAQLPKPEPMSTLEMAAKAAGVDLDLAKAGKKFSKASAEALGAVHKMLQECDKAMGALGYDKADNVQEDEEEAAKAAKTTITVKVADLPEVQEALEKAAGLETELTKVQGERDQLLKRVSELEALPEASKGVAVVVDAEKQSEMFHKAAQEAEAEDLKKYQETTDPEARYLASLKFTHKYGHKPE